MKFLNSSNRVVSPVFLFSDCKCRDFLFQFTINGPKKIEHNELRSRPPFAVGLCGLKCLDVFALWCCLSVLKRKKGTFCVPLCSVLVRFFIGV